MSTLAKEYFQSPEPMERRTRKRYPVRLTLRFRRRASGKSEYFAGETIDMSSAAIAIRAAGRVWVHERLEVAIDWPVPLHGSIPLQLIVSGGVVRVDESGFAITIDAREFRTQNRGSKLRPPLAFVGATA